MNEIYNKFKLQGNFLSTEDLRDLFTFYDDVRYVTSLKLKLLLFELQKCICWCCNLKAK